MSTQIPALFKPKQVAEVKKPKEKPKKRMFDKKSDKPAALFQIA